MRSMDISSAEAGSDRSKLVITSGWRTPMTPTTLWLGVSSTSAQRPSRKRGSRAKRGR